MWPHSYLTIIYVPPVHCGGHARQAMCDRQHISESVTDVHVAWQGAAHARPWDMRNMGSLRGCPVRALHALAAANTMRAVALRAGTIVPLDTVVSTAPVNHRAQVLLAVSHCTGRHFAHLPGFLPWLPVLTIRLAGEIHLSSHHAYLMHACPMDPA